MTLAIKPLARRFAAPALAAWLLYVGMWTILFAIEQQVMSLLGWLFDHIPINFGVVEKTYYPIQRFGQNMAEGLVPILLGLLAGLWVVRRKRQSLSQSD